MNEQPKSVTESNRVPYIALGNDTHTNNRGSEMRKYVAYYRVSTKKQQASGLGLEAQQATVAAHVKALGGEIVGEFTEVESGRKQIRKQLAEAIELAKQTGARLIVAKLDRLSRDIKFIFTLKDANVDFVCCDLPDFNTLTLGIFATFAQHEREEISRRTKAGLARAKARGVKLGKADNFKPEHLKKAIEARQFNAQTHANNQKAGALVVAEIARGTTLQKIADRLNERGYRTRKGFTFTRMQVARLRNREMQGA